MERKILSANLSFVPEAVSSFLTEINELWYSADHPTKTEAGRLVVAATNRP